MYPYESEWFIVLLLWVTELLLFQRLRLSRPEVTDGVNSAILQLLRTETEAPPQLLRGDITKEALTPSCDITKQTAGPWRAWEKQHYSPVVNWQRKQGTIWALFWAVRLYLYLHWADNFLSCTPTFPGGISTMKGPFSWAWAHKSGQRGSGETVCWHRLCSGNHCAMCPIKWWHPPQLVSNDNCVNLLTTTAFLMGGKNKHPLEKKTVVLF